MDFSPVVAKTKEPTCLSVSRLSCAPLMYRVRPGCAAMLKKHNKRAIIQPFAYELHPIAQRPQSRIAKKISGNKQNSTRIALFDSVHKDFLFMKAFAASIIYNLHNIVQQIHPFDGIGPWYHRREREIEYCVPCWTMNRCGVMFFLCFFFVLWVSVKTSFRWLLFAYERLEHLVNGFSSSSLYFFISDSDSESKWLCSCFHVLCAVFFFVVLS